MRAVNDARAAAARAAAAAAADGGGSGDAPTTTTTGRVDKPPELTAFEAGKEVMDGVRAAHAHAAAALEALLAELGAKFVPRAEERLLAVVHALLTRCYKVPVAHSAPVPAALQRELAGVCRACFSPDSAARHGPLMATYRAAFVADLSPEDNPAFAPTLGDLASRLKAWRATLQATVEALYPSPRRLESESRALAERSFAGAEMPGATGAVYGGHASNDPGGAGTPSGGGILAAGVGGGSGGGGPGGSGGFGGAGGAAAADGPVLIDRIGADVVVVRRHCTTYRRLTFWGSDGRARTFLVQTGQHWYSATGSPDERVAQLLRSFNDALADRPAPRARGLAWTTPAAIPVYPAVRLVEEDPSAATYGEAYETSCARYGRAADLPIIHFKKRVAGPDGRPAPDRGGDLRLAAFQEVEARLVTENVFSQYAYKTLPTPNHLWAFKRELCGQAALSGLAGHVLRIGGRAPPKILFARGSGRLWQADFVPSYDGRGLLDGPDPVPFRLTRNLATFFTAFGVEGVFIGALALGAEALAARGAGTADALALYLREDGGAFAAWRGAAAAAAAAAASAGAGGGGDATPGAAQQPATPPSAAARPPPARDPAARAAVDANLAGALARVRAAAPAAPGEATAAGSVQRGAAELVEAATNPRNLCRMDPTWHPWF